MKETLDFNSFLNIDCMEYMKEMKDKSVDFTLTDIPYGEVSRATGTLTQLSNLDKLGVADIVTFNVQKFCEEVYRITKNMICIFCGREQFSDIFKFFASKPGTTRPIVWQKTNPVPSNGQYVYLSGVEFAVWFKRKGGTHFNANCKNTVFSYPIPGGKNRIHPTQKHWGLWKELMLDCSCEGDLIFDPCAGSGVTAWVAAENKRNFLCLELDKETYEKSYEWLKREKGLFKNETNTNSKDS